ncbi:MAG TPA: SWIM zinc finger family protein, partial [Flavisolibacter sp.]
MSTPLTIYNFPSSISPQQVKKGEDYFESGAVDEAIETTTGKWQAEVSGTEIYHIKIVLKDAAIVRTSCDCPHDDPFCKHVVAVLFAIQNQLGMTLTTVDDSSSKKMPGALTKSASFETVLKKTDEKDLRDFVASFAARSKEFRSLFLLRFDVAKTKDSLEKFCTLIRKTAATYTHRGFIEYSHSTKALQGAADVLDEAEAAFQKGNFRITFEACCAVIMEVPLLIGHMDDSNGHAGDCIHGAFECLEQLAGNADVPYGLKDELFAFAQKELKKAVYHDFGFEDNLLALLSAAAYEEEKQNAVFTVIDHLLSKAREDYGRIWLLDAKMALLRKAGRANEADSLLLQNKNIPQYREQLIQRHINNKNYTAAKLLAEEGVAEENKKQGWHKHPERWEEWLLKTALLQRDIPSVRKYAKAIYFKRFDHNYYKLYKETFTAAEWEEEYQTWIKWFTDKGRIGINEMYALANIYISEKLHERLLILLQINPEYEFAQYCQPHLEQSFWPELLVIYRQALLSNAASANSRSNYMELCKRLKAVQKLHGGKELVKELKDYFLHNYKQRRAMKEELEKI